MEDNSNQIIFESARPIASSIAKSFEQLRVAMNDILGRLDFDDPSYRHNLTMAKCSKKKRMRKKYYKKCLK